MPGIMTINGDLDPAGTAVKDTIKQLREQNAAHNLANREKICDFYFNRQYQYIDQKPYQDKKGDLLIPLYTVNITEKIINKTSLVYKNVPDRILDGPKSTRDVYSDFIAEHPQFSEGLKTAERLKNALHTVIYRPMWYKGSWRFNWIETEWSYVFEEGDPLNPIGYIIPLKRDTYNTNVKSMASENWSMYWSKDYYFLVSDGGDIKFDSSDPAYSEGKNPFGRFPFIEMRKRLAVDDPWPEGAIDLVNCNESINTAINDLNLSIRFQAFDQVYMTGVDKKDTGELELGPNKIVYINDATASAGLLGYNPKLQETIEVIQSQINIIGFAYNCHIDWALTATPASGFSLLIQNIDLLEAREDDVSMCKIYERELYEVIQVQTDKLKTDTKVLPQLSKAVDLRVDFQEIDFPINEQEKRDADDWDISHNIKTPIDIIQERNPDMNEKEAEKKYLANKEINANYSQRQKALADKLKEEEIEVEVEKE